VLKHNKKHVDTVYIYSAVSVSHTFIFTIISYLKRLARFFLHLLCQREIFVIALLAGHQSEHLAGKKLSDSKVQTFLNVLKFLLYLRIKLFHIVIVRFADSMVRRSRADCKTSSSGVMADVVGAVGTVCHIEPPVLTAHHTVSTAPQLPPRVPIQHKTLSSPSRRKSSLHSPSHSSCGSVISTSAVDDNLTEQHHDFLDIFIPSSVDSQPFHDTAYVTVYTGAENAADQKPSTFPSVESEPICDVFSDGQKFSTGSDADDGLDVVIATDHYAGDEKMPTLDSPESKQTAVTVVSGHDIHNFHDHDISKGRSRQFDHLTRPNVIRRLTRKETTKLSRKLTRKMSCRQQCALMMEAEFDEFDELDVVIEGEADDDDDDAGSQSSLGNDCEEEEGNDDKSELKTGRHSDISDDVFSERVTTRLHCDRFQVYLARSANLPEGLYILPMFFQYFFLMVDFLATVAQTLMEQSSPKF